MPQIDLSILNQRQTPAFYADVLANRPAAGFIGRIFVSTNTFEFYRDNGTGWDIIGGPGAGTVTGGGSLYRVAIWNSTSSIGESNNLIFDFSTNRLGIGTNAPGTALDVHSTQSTILQLNQTSINDTRIAFQLSGAALWRIGNFYNGGANDFELFDVIGAQAAITVKKTSGQVLIGTSTVGSGKLVVASATGDNQIQIVGANAPSLRIDNLESGPTKRVGLGISTAVNNFIQGSVDRDFCIFNGSTTSSPMLFGIYGTTNVQEAARISAARNFIIGSTTDTGNKLQNNGDTFLSSNVGIGVIPASNITIRCNKNITGNTVSTGISQAGVVQSDVTILGRGIINILNTQAASFTLPDYFHFLAQQSVIGVGSSVTSQIGFYVDNTLIGAGTNFGFRSDIPSGTNRWNLYMNGTANNYMAGNLGIGNTSVDTIMLRISKGFTNTLAGGILLDGTIQSTGTGQTNYLQTTASTAATSFTAASIRHINIQQGTFGAGSTVTNQFGVFVGANMIGATSNYGFFGDIPSGTNRWNLYMAGTAANYMAGTLSIGTTASTRTVDILGALGVNTVLKLESGSSTTQAYLQLAYNGATNAQSGYVGYDTSSNLILYTANTERLRVNSVGLNIGGNASNNASAKVQIDSTTQGFLPPRMTLAQKNAIASPAEGLIIYQTDGTVGIYIYSGGLWKIFTIV
jgi:hypothetical protein